MKKLSLFFLAFSFMVLFQQCRKNNDAAAATSSKGTVSGSITGSSSQSISGAQVIVFNANTNVPVTTVATSSNGNYSIQLDTGNYYLRIYAQGYQSIPLRGMSAIPFTILANNTLTNNYQMNSLAGANVGLISGKVTSGGNPVPGVLVVAHAGAAGYSSISDNSGNYTIYNLPASNYAVAGHMANYRSDSITVAVAGSVNSTGSNITLTSGVSGAVSGTITFLATANKEVDVSLINPYTKEAIPGLSTVTTGGSYSISKVPDGNYIARASYKNDSIVMDPDWILKNGQPAVTVSGTTASRNFSVTDAVLLLSPTNSPASTAPLKISGTTPAFSWAAYPSTSDYVIEVSDENGNVIWGGFSGSGATITKNFTMPASQTSITYNSNNMATQPLQAGHVYRWKIYASKNTSGTPSWKLISCSEEQMGLMIP